MPLSLYAPDPAAPIPRALPSMKLCGFCSGSGHQLDGVIRYRPCWPCYGHGTTEPPVVYGWPKERAIIAADQPPRGMRVLRPACSGKARAREAQE